VDAAIFTLITGIGATAAIDLWAIGRRRLFATPLPRYDLVGRWIGHLARGRWRHEGIDRSSPVAGERAIGWLAHYAIGIAFAAVLIGIAGHGWIAHPTLGPALAVGIGTVAAPWLVMQPAMGAGIAARRTPRPGAARAQSLLTHTLFGAALYAAGWLARAIELYRTSAG
jgi:hypothetical protein